MLLGITQNMLNIIPADLMLIYDSTTIQVNVPYIAWMFILLSSVVGCISHNEVE